MEKFDSIEKSIAIERRDTLNRSRKSVHRVSLSQNENMDRCGHRFIKYADSLLKCIPGPDVVKKSARFL